MSSRVDTDERLYEPRSIYSLYSRLLFDPEHQQTQDLVEGVTQLHEQFHSLSTEDRLGLLAFWHPFAEQYWLHRATFTKDSDNGAEPFFEIVCGECAYHTNSVWLFLVYQCTTLSASVVRDFHHSVTVDLEPCAHSYDDSTIRQAIFTMYVMSSQIKRKSLWPWRDLSEDTPRSTAVREFFIAFSVLRVLGCWMVADKSTKLIWTQESSDARLRLTLDNLRSTLKVITELQKMQDVPPVLREIVRATRFRLKVVQALSWRHAQPERAQQVWRLLRDEDRWAPGDEMRQAWGIEDEIDESAAPPIDWDREWMVEQAKDLMVQGIPKMNDLSYLAALPFTLRRDVQSAASHLSRGQEAVSWLLSRLPITK